MGLGLGIGVGLRSGFGFGFGSRSYLVGEWHGGVGDAGEGELDEGGDGLGGEHGEGS